MSKLTLKNVYVYTYFIDNAREDDYFVKPFYIRNADEISRRFGINNYAGFNFHVRKVLDNKSAYIKLSNELNEGGVEDA